MFRTSATRTPWRSPQRGSALTIAILLLLLLTIAVFAAMPAMLGEQRVSGNDVRTKIAQHVADAGLSHGREFLRLHQTTMLPANGQALGSEWESCAAGSTDFPCGAIEPDLATSATRANYYYYDVGAASPAITFPTPGKLYDGSSSKTVGNFETEYEVGILLCRLDSGNDCVTDPVLATGTALFTLVSRGSVDGERATATVQETIGAYKILDVPPELPPLIASGQVQGVGNATVVGNPNSGGFGIPLILWSYQDFDSNNGSWQSCQMDEYLRSGLGSVTMEGSRQDVPICALGACNCSGYAIVSENGTEGVDVLDSNSADGGMTVPSNP